MIRPYPFESSNHSRSARPFVAVVGAHGPDFYTLRHPEFLSSGHTRHGGPVSTTVRGCGVSRVPSPSAAHSSSEIRVHAIDTAVDDVQVYVLLTGQRVLKLKIRRPRSLVDPAQGSTGVEVDIILIHRVIRPHACDKRIATQRLDFGYSHARSESEKRTIETMVHSVLDVTGHFVQNPNSLSRLFSQHHDVAARISGRLHPCFKPRWRLRGFLYGERYGLARGAQNRDIEELRKQGQSPEDNSAIALYAMSVNVQRQVHPRSIRL